jgi:hypothetical protein
MLGGAKDPDAAGAVLDDGQDIDPGAVEQAGGEQSSARIPCAWDRRNSAQPGPSRRGAGSIPAPLRICQTVAGATAMPSPASSPWIRRQPRDWFSPAGRRTIDRTVRCTGGRPERPCDTRARRRRTISRCHRMIVPGVTISRIAARRPAGSVPGSADHPPR